MINNKWMTLNDVMEFFGTSKYTIYRWMKEGKFPIGKMAPGGRIWSVASLDKWLSVEDPPNSGVNASKLNKDLETAPGKELPKPE